MVSPHHLLASAQAAKICLVPTSISKYCHHLLIKPFWNIQWADRYQYWLEICGQTWLVSLRIRSATDQQQFMNRSTLPIAVCLCQINPLCVCQLTDQQRRCLIIANRDAVWSSAISNLQRRIHLGIYIGKHEFPASLQEAHNIVLISSLHAGAITNQHLRNVCGNC